MKKSKTTIAIASSLSLGAFANSLVDETSGEVKKLKQQFYEGNEDLIPNSKIAQHVRSQRKIQRNELCPCQSGKKYKKCCMP